MITSYSLEQEFFIYVPILDTVETPTDINPIARKGTELKCVGINPIYDGWVKISLQGQIIVYARLQDEEKLKVLEEVGEHKLW